MSDKELTISEMAKMGGEARAEQMTPEERQNVAKKGGETIKAKYGPDHFKRMNELSQASKAAKKKKAREDAKPKRRTLKEFLGLK